MMMGLYVLIRFFSLSLIYKMTQVTFRPPDGFEPIEFPESRHGWHSNEVETWIQDPQKELWLIRVPETVSCSLSIWIGENS
jgi:hypothetical protein